MSIDQLTAVVPPPHKPLETGRPRKLSQLQKRLGITLPKDYIEMGNTYGTGTFYDPNRMEVTVLNPFSSRYIESLQYYCDFFHMAKDYKEDAVPYDIFPKVPGLLPWGTDANGSTMSWLTEGSAEDWAILVVGARGLDYYEQFDMPITEFLAACFTRKITCHVWKNPVLFSGPEPMRFVKADPNGRPVT